jgi:hypothetical protein
LVCCHGYDQTDLPNRAAAFLKGHTDQEASLLERPPAHVTHLLDSPELSEESELEMPAGLGYVVVLHEHYTG